MSDTLLNALKIFVVVGAILLVGGTATLIWVLVKRATSRDAAQTTAPATPQLPATVTLPAGARIDQASLSGSQLLLLGSAPGEGQFLLIVDAASGARRRYLRLMPEQP